MQLNKIYNADCLSILNNSSKIQQNSVQVIFADPPYNLSGHGLKSKNSKTGGDFTMVNEDWDKMGEAEFINFTNDWIKSSKKVLKANGSIFIACSYHNIGESMISLKANGFKINNIITWNKSNAMPNLTRRVLTHTTEFVIWAVKGKGWIFNYDKLKELNPNKKQDGTDKQMRDIWTMPLCQGKERLRAEDGKKSTASNPKTRITFKKNSIRIFK
jgi:site-specific DNA-methyltransferase (adenine-specific)/modification methylase